MRPDDESVIHITEPSEGLMGCLVELHIKAFHDEVGENQRQWQNHSHTIGLFVILATETEA
jgi:hypothetical protein